MSDTLIELAARCEAATGPDRDLDRAIARLHVEAILVKHGEKQASEIAVHMIDARLDADMDAYTASLDAAMTLLDPAWFFHVSRFSPESDGRGQAHVYPNRGLGDDYEGEAATPALALCAAALRARAVQ